MWTILAAGVGSLRHRLWVLGAHPDPGQAVAWWCLSLYGLAGRGYGFWAAALHVPLPYPGRGKSCCFNTYMATAWDNRMNFFVNEVLLINSI